MFSLILDGWSLAFVRVPQSAPLHRAIRVAPETFTSAIGRLSESGIAFGNDPEDAANGRTDDPLGGTGRAYFRDPDGHFYELVAAPAPG
jgi:catechol 2,3-dioxygenase-like lactoylglutathione lyase family enzyme